MIKITYIVPIFNGEEYLSTCLDSLFNQGLNMDEFEIICVDDFSSDNSQNIILDYSKKYSNLLYILNEKNLKTSTSLNRGLKQARGKYIWIVGQDDVIEPQSATKVLRYCEENELDVIAFNYRRIGSKNDIVSRDKVFCNEILQEGRDFIKRNFYDTFCIYLLGYEWRAVYNREFLANYSIAFPENTIYEDTTFMFKAFWYSKRFMSIEDFLYNYRINDNSVTDVSKRYKANRIYDFFMVADEVLKFAKEVDDEYIKSQLIEISKKYLRSFTYTIIPAIYSEKKLFYSLVKNNWTNIRLLISSESYYVKILLYPYTGCVLTTIFKPLFRVKHLLNTKNYSNI